MRGQVHHNNTSMTKHLFNYLRQSVFLVAIVAIAGCNTGRYISSEMFRIDQPYDAKENSAASQSLFLIGDAGAPMLDRTEPNFIALQKQLSVLPEKNTVLFLGDNIYPAGLPPTNDNARAISERILDEQLRIVEQSGARGIFIPGNHDWNQDNVDGFERIRNQENYIAAKGNPRIQLLPKNGCPGPEVLNIGSSVRIIILDTQWWLLAGMKSTDISKGCTNTTKRDILDALSVALRTAGSRYVIVAAHHALETHGPHGGFFDWRDHLFPLRNFASWLLLPLPGIGSIYPLARNSGISEQDLSHALYEEMRKSIDSVLTLYPPLAYVAGHEHTLQVLKGSKKYFALVSGNGISAHSSALTTAPSTLFADRKAGFMRIDFGDEPVLRIFQPTEEGEGVEVFRMFLK